MYSYIAIIVDSSTLTDDHVFMQRTRGLVTSSSSLTRQTVSVFIDT